ncbi:MAG: addiction module protein [Deltaproteobacteria bacterium]
MGKAAVEIDALSKNERLELIERLWDSLDQAEDVSVTAAQRQELRRREDALDVGELRTLPAEDVLSAIRSRRVPR